MTSDSASAADAHDGRTGSAVAGDAFTPSLAGDASTPSGTIETGAHGAKERRTAAAPGLATTHRAARLAIAASAARSRAPSVRKNREPGNCRTLAWASHHSESTSAK